MKQEYVEIIAPSQKMIAKKIKEIYDLLMDDNCYTITISKEKMQNVFMGAKTPFLAISVERVEELIETPVIRRYKHDTKR